MKQLATAKRTDEFIDIHDVPLKNGLTCGDFVTELDCLRAEMNQLIYQTHQKSIREKFSAPGKNYYQEMLSEITYAKFPGLHTHLVEAGFIQYPLEEAGARIAADIGCFIKQLGMPNIASGKIEALLDKIALYKEHPKCKSIYNILSTELAQRKEKQKLFLSIEKSRSSQIPLLSLAYSQMCYADRKKHQ